MANLGGKRASKLGEPKVMTTEQLGISLSALKDVNDGKL